MRGRHPKPPHLRQNRTKKAGAAILSLDTPTRSAPDLPNPDSRKWHPLTLESWQSAWRSPMAAMWLKTDEDALGRLAILWDEFYREPKTLTMAEIRLQEQRFGLSPMDRVRLSWTVAKADEGRARRSAPVRPTRTAADDPRNLLMWPNG